MTIQSILTKFEPDRENLLAAAKEVNKQFGFVSQEAVDKLAKYFDMKPAEVFSAVSFYDQINTKAPAQLEIKVCDGANCHLKMAEEIISEAERFFGMRAGDDFSPKVRIRRESCFGMCLVGPIMVVNGTMYERVVPGRVEEILRNYT